MLAFLDDLGGASAGFIAEQINRPTQVIAQTLDQLRRRGEVVRWWFDGLAIYALPENAPDPEILEAPREAKSYGGRRDVPLVHVVRVKPTSEELLASINDHLGWFRRNLKWRLPCSAPKLQEDEPQKRAA